MVTQASVVMMLSPTPIIGAKTYNAWTCAICKSAAMSCGLKSQTAECALMMEVWW